MENKNKIKNVILLVVTILFLSFISAQDACYVEFSFNESLIDINGINSNLVMSYAGIENLYGPYIGSVNEYSEYFAETYRLDVLNSAGNVLRSYSFGTGLLLFYDNFGDEENPSGIEMLDSSQTSAIIPYVDGVSSGKVYFDDELKLEFPISGISCQRNCLTENEFSSGDPRCCSGLTRVRVSSENVTCTNCGDGICSEFEDYFLCSSDCNDTRNYTCAAGYVKGLFGCVISNYCGNYILESGEKCDDGNNFGGDGCDANCEIELCYDADFSSINSSSVFIRSWTGGINLSKSYDYCLDENNLVEYSCGIDLLRWDFWNWAKPVKKSFTQYCENGCFDGACVEAELILECGVWGGCSEYYACVDGVCVLDLPKSPDEPYGSI